MKKNWKHIILITSMYILTFAICSTIVYAGFTRQYNPEVSSFSINISSQENMMISTSGESGTFKFKDVVKFSDLSPNNQEVSLGPLIGKVESSNDEEHQKLKLSSGSNEIDTNTLGFVNDKYLAFDLYFIASSEMNLYFAGNTSGTVALFESSNADISFTEDQRNALLKQLRIGFLTYSTAYESSETSTTIHYSDEPVKVNVYATEKLETENYQTFDGLGYTGTDNDTILATVKKDEVTRVRVVIWLEDGAKNLEVICKLSLYLRFEASKLDS